MNIHITHNYKISQTQKTMYFQETQDKYQENVDTKLS